MTIRTGIKFKRGENGSRNEGRLYGFVTKENGSWKGCREEDERPKKIVFPHSDYENTIVEGMLYWVTLYPICNNKCFVATLVTLAKFDAKIETIARKGIFLVYVKFGNKKITYNPLSDEPKMKDIKGIADYLRGRIDLNNAQQVAEDFLDAACVVKSLLTKEKRCL